jgi:GNAT superfamily N-acetyltransferase
VRLKNLDPWVARSYGPTVLPVAFAATLPLVGRKAHRRFHRLVVLPDYQGIGIGGRFLNAVAELHRGDGLRINIATSHPAIVAHCRASPRWRTVYVSRCGRKPRVFDGRLHDHSFGRAVVSFEYAGLPSLSSP